MHLAEFSAAGLRSSKGFLLRLQVDENRAGVRDVEESDGVPKAMNQLHCFKRKNNVDVVSQCKLDSLNQKVRRMANSRK